MNKITRGKVENIEITIKQVDSNEGIYGKVDHFLYSIILDNGRNYTTESSLRYLNIGDVVDIFNDDDKNIILTKSSAKKILKNERFCIVINAIFTLLSLCLFLGIIIKNIYEGRPSTAILFLPIIALSFGFTCLDTIQNIFYLTKEDKNLLKKYMLGYSPEQIVKYKIDSKLNIKDILKI